MVRSVSRWRIRHFAEPACVEAVLDMGAGHEVAKQQQEEEVPQEEPRP